MLHHLYINRGKLTTLNPVTYSLMPYTVMRLIQDSRLNEYMELTKTEAYSCDDIGYGRLNEGPVNLIYSLRRIIARVSYSKNEYQKAIRNMAN